MSSFIFSNKSIHHRARALPLGLAALAAALSTATWLGAQTVSPFQGSVTQGAASAEPIGLSLDEAMQRGLKANLGVILSGTQTAAARGERLSQLQALLPSVDFNARETVTEADLPAEGLRIPGFPAIIGPYGFTDLRASLSWSLVRSVRFLPGNSRCMISAVARLSRRTSRPRSLAN